MERQRLLTRTPLHGEHCSVATGEGGAGDAMAGGSELFEVTKMRPCSSFLALAWLRRCQPWHSRAPGAYCCEATVLVHRDAGAQAAGTRERRARIHLEKHHGGDQPHARSRGAQ